GAATHRQQGSAQDTLSASDTAQVQRIGCESIRLWPILARIALPRGAQRVGPVKRFFFLGLVGVALVVAGIVWGWLQLRQEAPVTAATSTPQLAARPAPGGPAVPDITAPGLPSFDIVRV